MLLLTADVTGNPLPDVSWTKDGAPLPSDERIFTGFDGDKVRAVMGEEVRRLRW